MNLQDFKAKWAAIQPTLLIEREVVPLYESGQVKDHLARQKRLLYGLMIGFFLAGVVLIIAGGAEQKNHAALIPLVVIGLCLALLVTVGLYIGWSFQTYRYLKQLTENSFTHDRLLQIYLTILKAFPFFQCHKQDTFVAPDGFIVLGGNVRDGKFKVVSSRRDVRFFLNQKPVLIKDTNLHNWNVNISLRVSILDPLKMQAEESFSRTVTAQIEQNLGVILGNLFTVYGKEALDEPKRSQD